MMYGFLLREVRDLRRLSSLALSLSLSKVWILS